MRSSRTTGRAASIPASGEGSASPPGPEFGRLQRGEPVEVDGAASSRAT